MLKIGLGAVRNPSSAKSAFSGKSGKIPNGSGFQSIIRNAMINGTKSYRDIDNAFSAGGHNGNGSPQSALVKPAKSGTVGIKKRSSSRGSSRGSGGSGGSGGSSAPSVPIVSSANEAFNYYEAPIAEKYGFSKTTAYQEALANTAYRREMEDMRKAGLNPSVIYGAHNTSGADADIMPYGDFPQPTSVSSGGSGGFGRRFRRGNSGKYVFSGGAYYGIMAAVGSITAMATKNVGAGMAAAGLAGTAMKALNGFFKK